MMKFTDGTTTLRINHEIRRDDLPPLLVSWALTVHRSKDQPVLLLIATPDKDEFEAYVRWAVAGYGAQAASEIDEATRSAFADEGQYETAIVLAKAVVDRDWPDVSSKPASKQVAAAVESTNDDA